MIKHHARIFAIGAVMLAVFVMFFVISAPSIETLR